MSAEAPKSVVLESSESDDPRQLASRVVHAIYRLIKGCFLHDDSNQAVANLIEFVIETTHVYCGRAGVEAVSVLFAGNSVFVNKQMLRASRETYQLALELGTILSGCGITEVTFERSIIAGEIGEFGRAVAAMHREKTPSPRFIEGGWTGLKVRKVVGFGGGEVLSPVTRVARTYAASIMIVRAFYADLKKGKLELSHSVKRVAQKLAGIPADERRLLLSTAAAPAADTDRAGLIVSSAIVSVVMAGQLTDDRSALTTLATAALLYDAGRARFLRGSSSTDGPIVERILSEDEEERLPNASIVALTALGKLHPQGVTRSVIVYEALSLRNEATTPYGGARQPHVLSRILSVARAFTELRVSRGTSPPHSVDDAIQVLTSQARDNIEKTFVKLLVGTLGVFPAGTLVELSTGELAVVVSTPRLPIDFARPPVRIMYDANGALLEEPIDLDLGNVKATEEGELKAPPRYIKKPIDASDQQMKQMRAYVMSLSSRRKRSTDRNRIDKAQLDAKAKPAVDRPLPRRRLSAPQAAIPAAVQALEASAKEQPVEVASSEPIGVPEAEIHEIVEVVSERRVPPGPPPKRAPVVGAEAAAAAARANADPEVSFERIDLQSPDSHTPSMRGPAVVINESSPSTSGSASGVAPVEAPASVRPGRPAVKRWDPRSEDAPPDTPSGVSAEGPAIEVAEIDITGSRPVPAKPASKWAGPSPVATTAEVVGAASSFIADSSASQMGSGVARTPSAKQVLPLRPPPRAAASIPTPPSAIPVVTAALGPSAEQAPPPTASTTPPPTRGKVPGGKLTTEILIPSWSPESERPAQEGRATGSTRQVSWTEYGKEIVEAVGVPEATPSETDAILAAYLSEEARDATDAGEGTYDTSSRNAGLRWDRNEQSTSGHATGRVSSGGHSTGGHSTGGHSTGRVSSGGHSTGGHATGAHRTSPPPAGSPNTAGLRWEGRGRDASSEGRDITASSSGRDVLSDDASWEISSPDHSTGGHSTGGHSTSGQSVPGHSSQGHSSQGGSSPGDSSQGRDPRTPASKQGERDSTAGSPSNQGTDPSGSPSLRGRAKAGSQGWGNPRGQKSK